MSLSVATWNINSVRLRLDLVLRFLEESKPDLLCLQEIKCQNSQFPEQAFVDAGYPFLAVNGQKGYHGVATVSRLPLHDFNKISFCNQGDCRHIAATIDWGEKRLRIHNFYVPAGGDEPDPQINPKFRHKLDFLKEMAAVKADLGDGTLSLLVGDLNIAPLENDVWSHKQLLKIVSHTPIETSLLTAAAKNGGWLDLMRDQIPEPQKIYTWWSYRAKDWAGSNRGRRLDHVWGSPELKHLVDSLEVFTAMRGWERPSDHVAVMVKFK